MNKDLLSGFLVRSSDVGAINIYHLLFADDTLIFIKANLDNLCNLRCTSLCFEAGSGMKINLANSVGEPFWSVYESTEDEVKTPSLQGTSSSLVFGC